MQNASTSSRAMALGGVLAAMAVCVMCLGSLIPVNTYVSPMLCALLLQVVLNACGGWIAWAWFFAVAILSLLLCPDREAAGVLLTLGYYPILKRFLDKKSCAFSGRACISI